MRRVLISSGIALAMAAAANAGVSVTYTASAPSYGTALNFDESGGPTGALVGNEWTGYGISSLISGNLDGGFVGDLNSILGVTWLGTGNAWAGAWGGFMNFSQDLTEFSCQYWDDSGPATIFSGGAIVVALNDGVEVGSFFIDNPTWGDTGPTWVNITTDSGSTFDEVRFVGFGWIGPTAVIDNLSWNAVPAPASAGVLALAGMFGARRRRA
ncbi:MAG: hypothetical protein IT434_10890 [Phycisphaerales bacterium]|jgi:hypothetical protein|nr:hypothetical protein [Phycisphaerales bacterium]